MLPRAWLVALVRSPQQRRVSQPCRSTSASAVSKARQLLDQELDRQAALQRLNQRPAASTTQTPAATVHRRVVVRRGSQNELQLRPGARRPVPSFWTQQPTGEQHVRRNWQQDLSVPAYINGQDAARLLSVSLWELHRAGRQLLPDMWPQRTRKQLSKHAGFSELKALVLKYEHMAVLCQHWGKQCTLLTNIERTDILPSPTPLLGTRQPIVAAIGHTDHGKTTLLDALRNSNTASREDFGITQELYHHQATLRTTAADGVRVTLLDSPGHQAFSEMRVAAGWFADVLLVVVSSQDIEGVQQQSREAVDVAKRFLDKSRAIIVITKADTANSNPQAVLADLQTYAGVHFVPANSTQPVKRSDIPYLVVSAKTGFNMDVLVKNIAHQNSFLELDFDAGVAAAGAVMEASREDRGRGNVTTVILRNGTLRLGQHFIAGLYKGVVKNLRVGGRSGTAVDEVLPGVAVEIVGCEGVPAPGTEFFAASQSRVEMIAKIRKNEFLYAEQEEARLAAESARRQAEIDKRIALEERENHEQEVLRDEKDLSALRTEQEEHMALENDITYEAVGQPVDAQAEFQAAEELDNPGHTDDLMSHSFIEIDTNQQVSEDKKVYASLKDLRRSGDLHRVSSTGPRSILLRSFNLGSLRMLVDAIQTMHKDLLANDHSARGVQVLDLRCGLITRHDLLMASADKSPIFCLRTGMPTAAELKVAQQLNVPIRHFKHFQYLLDAVRQYAATGELAPS